MIMGQGKDMKSINLKFSYQCPDTADMEVKKMGRKEENLQQPERK